MTVGDIDSCSLGCLLTSRGQSATFPPDEALQIVNRLAYERQADLPAAVHSNSSSVWCNLSPAVVYGTIYH